MFRCFFDAFLPFPAGMNIIAKNMSGSKVFDPVIPGTKVFAIFGFCDIRNFTDCCEVLEEETSNLIHVFVSDVYTYICCDNELTN